MTILGLIRYLCKHPLSDGVECPPHFTPSSIPVPAAAELPGYSGNVDCSLGAKTDLVMIGLKLADKHGDIGITIDLQKFDKGFRVIGNCPGFVKHLPGNNSDSDRPPHVESAQKPAE
jgi:hypothetical protein